jgi:hypothetical protein
MLTEHVYWRPVETRISDRGEFRVPIRLPVSRLYLFLLSKGQRFYERNGSAEREHRSRNAEDPDFAACQPYYGKPMASLGPVCWPKGAQPAKNGRSVVPRASLLR